TPPRCQAQRAGVRDGWLVRPGRWPMDRVGRRPSPTGLGKKGGGAPAPQAARNCCTNRGKAPEGKGKRSAAPFWDRPPGKGGRGAPARGWLGAEGAQE